MFYNGANCDVYIGKNAGKKLLEDIRNARKSVKIVSPYLSPFLISELIKLSSSNIDVELITTDNIEDYNGHDRNIYKLILRNRETDYEAVRIREKWKSRRRALIQMIFGLLFSFIAAAYYFQELEVAYGLIPIFIIYLKVRHLKNNVKNKRIYTYWYSQLFPFKVYGTPYTSEYSDTSIHSKIYIIDDEIAYLGSLNFTSSGTKYNYETRVRIVDLNAVGRIAEEFYQLMNHAPLPEKDLQTWGKQLYIEPIN